MAQLREIAVPPMSAGALGPLIGADRVARLEASAVSTRALLDGRTVWNVNSTAPAAAWPRCCTSSWATSVDSGSTPGGW